jgi:hypothetical protein
MVTVTNNRPEMQVVDSHSGGTLQNELDTVRLWIEGGIHDRLEDETSEEFRDEVAKWADSKIKEFRRWATQPRDTRPALDGGMIYTLITALMLGYSVSFNPDIIYYFIGEHDDEYLPSQ